MKKKPDRKFIAATLAFLAGAASMAVGPLSARPSPEAGPGGGMQADRVLVRLPRLSDEKKFPAHFVVTGGS
jgi:hypothetical protein